MTLVWHFERPQIPARAAALSFAALAVPVIQTLYFNDVASEPGVLLWLVSLIPAFLLAYYRGWKGTATALAVGMVALTLTHLILVVQGGVVRNWALLFWVTVAYLAISLAAGWISEGLHEQRAAAERRALTDDLTGLWNRRRARMHLEELFKLPPAARNDVAVVLYDLDKFKFYNDLHGHAAGDDALRVFARSLMESTRDDDLSARYGGEEFLTVLSSCDEQGATAFVDRVRTRVSGAGFDGLTACAGIACYQTGMESPNELLIAADRALYEAKKVGPDSVRVYRSAHESPA